MRADTQREVELARRFIGGDGAAFEELVAVFRPWLMQRAGFPEWFDDAEDLVQATSWSYGATGCGFGSRRTSTDGCGLPGLSRTGAIWPRSENVWTHLSPDAASAQGRIGREFHSGGACPMVGAGGGRKATASRYIKWYRLPCAAFRSAGTRQSRVGATRIGLI